MEARLHNGQAFFLEQEDLDQSFCLPVHEEAPNRMLQSADGKQPCLLNPLSAAFRLLTFLQCITLIMKWISGNFVIT